MRLVHILRGVLIFSIFINYSQVISQVIVTGVIIDKSDSTGLPFVSVILYQYQSSKMLDYTQTDDNGNFSLTIPDESILTIKTSRLGYHPHQQDVVIANKQQKDFHLKIALASNTVELDEVIVQGPILVKEDTIIYDIEHFLKARSETLEDVLADIPGFKIKEDGKIEVNGKYTVQKVLIDGTEISDVGSALITRSLSASDVEKVELRTNEQNDKIKESLLDASEYVVLDIKLKGDLKKSLFGKIRATSGIQNSGEIGGYLNGFSFKQKAKVHLFAEHDRFGEQTISLAEIKNLGEEAFQNIFEIPADFQVLTEREEFNKELYGFKNYTNSWKDIVGVSGKISFSKKLDLYIGSYNSYSNDRKARDYEQSFINGLGTVLDEEEQIEDYSTKNKIDFRYDADKLKIKLDLNTVLFKNEMATNNYNRSSGINYKFDNAHTSRSLYQNLKLEYLPTSKIGFSLKAATSYINSDRKKNLNHNDESYATFFLDDSEYPVYHLKQDITNKGNNLLVKFGTTYKAGFGTLSGGLHFQRKDQSSRKTTINNDGLSNVSISDFSGVNHNLLFKNVEPYIEYDIGYNSISFSTRLGYAHTIYSSGKNEVSKKDNINYSIGTTLNGWGLDFAEAKFSKKMSAFPLNKLTEGQEIVDFQTISIPNDYTLQPQQESTFEFIASEKINSIKLLVDGVIILGKIKNADRYLVDRPFIGIYQNQLISQYLLISVPLTKTFKSIPIKLILEPELLNNQIQNLGSTNSIYTTKTIRKLLGLKIDTDFMKPYNFFVYPKYSSFNFKNTLTNEISTQEMVSYDISLNFDFLNKKLLVTPNIRTVNFFGKIISKYTNIDLRVEYISNRSRSFISISNLLDENTFVIQEIYPTYFLSELNAVFSRFIKFGYEFKF